MRIVNQPNPIGLRFHYRKFPYRHPYINLFLFYIIDNGIYRRHSNFLEVSK